MPAAPNAVLSVSAGAYSIVKDRAPHLGTPFVMQAHGTSWMEIDSKLRVHNLRSLAGAALIGKDPGSRDRNEWLDHVLFPVSSPR